MQLTQVLGRTWVLEGRGMMGLYRLDGRRCILLDSGEIGERDALAAALDGAGLVPVGALASHVHIDHTVNHGWLRHRYGCQVAMPAGEAHLCASPLALKGYLTCYSPDALARIWGDMVCPPDRLIPAEDGLFSFCGAYFRVVHTPGHSLDHLSIITPDNVCYTGDAVFSGDMLSAKLPYGLCLSMMMDSAPILKGLDCDAYIVCHRGVHQKIGGLVDKTRDLIRGRAEEIRLLAAQPMTREELWRAAIDHFSLYTSHASRAALLERNFQSYLDYLVDAGALAVSAQRGLILYQMVRTVPSEAGDPASLS